MTTHETECDQSVALPHSQATYSSAPEPRDLPHGFFIAAHLIVGFLALIAAFFLDLS